MKSPEEFIPQTKIEGENDNFGSNLNEEDQITEKTQPNHKLSDILEKAGIESEVLKVENGGEFSEVILLNKKETPKEKVVRLYRGVNHMDSSILEQIPYAMRAENSTGKPTILENVRQEVEELAKNPTYKNLLAYVNKVRSNLTQKETRRLEQDFIRIEDGILKGYSTRKELLYKQIEHGGGWGDSGITPYISTSIDPYEAVGYGKAGLIVMDVPLSEIEDFKSDAKEVNIKGTLNKKYITAIMPRKREGLKEKKELDQELYQALQKTYKHTPTNLYNAEELKTEREKIITQKTQLDKVQWEKDVEHVRQRRVDNLTREFSEVKFNLQNANEQNIDIYTKAKRDIYDFYKTRSAKIGKHGINIENYEYQESDYGSIQKFNRENINETMLLKLKTFVENFEAREEKHRKF